MLFSKAALFTSAVVFSTLVFGEKAPEGNVKVHVIQVGDNEGNLKFYPEELDVPVGELVQFQFYPLNHSVAQSTFADPCIPISESASGNGTNGFFSGFMPVKKTDTFMPTFTVLVNQTAPLWFYCATGPHCQRGMSGVINPPKNNAERTLAKYKESAIGSTTKVPGPPEGGETDPDGPSGPEPPTTVPTLSPNNTRPTPLPYNPDSAGFSVGASAVTVVLGAVAAAFFLA